MLFATAKEDSDSLQSPRYLESRTFCPENVDGVRTINYDSKMSLHPATETTGGAKPTLEATPHTICTPIWLRLQSSVSQRSVEKNIGCVCHLQKDRFWSQLIALVDTHGECGSRTSQGWLIQYGRRDAGQSFRSYEHSHIIHSDNDDRGKRDRMTVGYILDFLAKSTGCAGEEEICVTVL